MPEPKQVCCGISCCIVLITAIVLIATSFQTVDPNHVGLDYNGITLKINQAQLFQSGRHFLGVGHSFIIYPLTAQSVKFNNMNSRTNDGLLLTLDVNFNYQLVGTLSALNELYFTYGELPEIDQLYQRVAKNVVRVISSKYTAFDVLYNQTAVRAEMQSSLNLQLTPLHGSVDSFQLLNIELPRRFLNQRTRQDTAQQEIQKAVNEQSVAAEQARTTVIEAQRQAQIIVVEAQATANAMLLNARATADSIKAAVAAEKTSFTNVKSKLGLDKTSLLSYVWLDAVQKPKGAKLTVGIPAPAGVTKYP
jgi:regulator of protease activity HflC (stomatin/prohibitin superfamily)